MIFSETETQQRLENSIQFLDDHCPDWLDKINLETLDMFSNCILDQVFGDYLTTSAEFPNLIKTCLFDDRDAQQVWVDKIKELRNNK